MASIQAKMHNGRKYWCIVESMRINGKPRAKVIEYLGTADSLLRRLQNKEVQHKVKSVSHGCVAALLMLAQKLDVVSIINKHTHSQREYWTDQPLRNNLTAGITLLLASIGRICEPTSKRGWHIWAQKTSCEHMLRISLAQLDSQHFWDLMDCIPDENIEEIELEILRNTLKYYPLKEGTLLYDTTNFFTFINSTNDRCEIAQRGKNKQKRTDLRQVGLALVVTQENYMPLIHKTYAGNMSDCKVFAKIIASIKERLEKLGIDISLHTIIFDRGCNSKKNLRIVKRLKLHYVGALTPAHHKDLIKAADGKFVKVQVGELELGVYREKRAIWGEERTVLVFISEKLKDGQLRGIYQSLEKKKGLLRKIQRALANPGAKKRSREYLGKRIEKILGGQFMEELIDYKLTELKEGHWSLTYSTNKKKFLELEDKIGFRIVMTDRHDWESGKIIESYYGQATVEGAFKNIKNPYHLAFTPEFHWTDHKIKIHYFTCILGYLLSTLIWHEARKVGFGGTLDNLLDSLNDIRLSRQIKMDDKQGKPKVSYQVEEMSEEQEVLFKALDLSDTHLKPLKIEGVGEYKQACS
ncbi:MAG: IS1634 family transposase [Chlamydiota bacterium]